MGTRPKDADQLSRPPNGEMTTTVPTGEDVANTRQWHRCDRLSQLSGYHRLGWVFALYLSVYLARRTLAEAVSSFIKVEPDGG